MSAFSDSEEQYGILDHPSGIVLPKLLRSMIPSSQLDDEENDSTHWEPKDREWTVEELYHAVNQTSQQLLNVQSQILNGEDYYINNLSSISIYNSSKNFDASFLDSRNESNTVAGTGPSVSVGTGSNSHRWFSSSFTDLSPYQHLVKRPDLPKPIQPIMKNLATTAPTSTKPVTTAPEKNKSSEIVAPLLSSASIGVTSTKHVKDLKAAESTTPKTLPLEDKVPTLKPLTRKSERAPAPPPPERRTTKRRRKSTS